MYLQLRLLFATASLKASDIQSFVVHCLGLAQLVRYDRAEQADVLLVHLEYVWAFRRAANRFVFGWRILGRLVGESCEGGAVGLGIQAEYRLAFQA